MEQENSMKRWWFNSMLFKKEFEHRCRLSKSTGSLGPIASVGESKDPSINDTDKNIQSCGGHDNYNNVDLFFGVKDIRNFISDDTFLVKDSLLNISSFYSSLRVKKHISFFLEERKGTIGGMKNADQSDDHTLLGDFKRLVTHITKRHMDLRYDGRQSQPHAPAANFFSPKRRKQSNLLKELGSGTGVSSHSAWNAANDCGYVCNLYQVNQCLDQRQNTTRKPDDCHARRVRTDNERKKKGKVASEPPQRRVQARLATVMGQPVPTSDVQNPKEQTTSHTIGQPLRQRRKRNRGADDSNTRRRKSSSDCTSASPNTIHVPGEPCGSHFSKAALPVYVPSSNVQSPQEQTTSHRTEPPLRQCRKRNRGPDNSNTGHKQKRKSSSNCTSGSPNTIHVPAEASTSHVNEVNRPRFDDNSAKPYDKRRSRKSSFKQPDVRSGTNDALESETVGHTRFLAFIFAIDHCYG
ncbi:acetyl-coenzyme A carboxylase carboxyl transferase subunit beta, plastid [Artemisia annua]|uniref:Acetyl-coenzyme A carboxylase carboxyl transferase subunit beta, plastid n=1 Tax=Artemisia annua TaxID=35608 RepID=A0A2U1Q3E6_ARTAN|nr:acetyl-coenzyme A carboxylase carboxyl transferase subunit beta, plastid [Artemisia annua]